MFFETACIINHNAKLNTVCNYIAAMTMAEALSGLTEVIAIGYDNEVACTTYYLDGDMVAAVQPGAMWGPELTAIIEANA